MREDLRKAPWAVAIACLLGGCYTGLDTQTGGEPPSGQDGGDEGADGGDAGESGDDDDDDDDSAAECTTPDAGKTRLRRLTRDQYRFAVGDLIGFAADYDASLDLDERIGPFASNYSTPIDGTLLDQYMAAAEDAASIAAEHIDTLVPCDPAEPDCASDYVRSLARRAYRRPLSEVEHDRLIALMSGEDTFEDGALLVLQAVLQSPNFIYHVETVDSELAEVTPFELAARMSFFLWRSVPDDELLDVAEAGMLEDSGTVAEQAKRMLADERAARALVGFHREWLDVAKLPQVEKAPELYPDFAQTRESMDRELGRFVRYVLEEDDGRVETLLTAPYAFVEEPLASVYGVELPPDNDPEVPMMMPPEERAGILTLPGFLAVHADPSRSDPIKRGVAVVSNVLCAPPPPPPNDLEIEPPEIDPNATTRQQFEQHTADPACRACHESIDGVGLGFEAYDAIGRFRTTENGLPVDDRGELVGVDNGGSFAGVPELAAMLAESQSVHRCVTRQWFRYALGRWELPQDDCTFDDLQMQFDAADHDLNALLVAIVTSDAFRHKRYATEESQ